MASNDRTKVEIMLVNFLVVADNGRGYEGSPFSQKSTHGTASECYRQIADKFHEMARQDDEITRKLQEAEGNAYKAIEDDAWGKVPKA